MGSQLGVGKGTNVSSTSYVLHEWWFPLLRRILALVATLVLASAAFALTVNAADSGNCSTKGHWIANKQPLVNNIAGMIGRVDPVNTSALCSNPGGIQDNGVYHALSIVENGACTGGGTTCPQLSIGVLMCDNPLTPGCDSVGRDTWHYWINNVDCSPFHLDFQLDLGTANSPWASHIYEMVFNYAAATWLFYLDGVQVWSVPTTGVTGYGCFNESTPGNRYAGTWQSERWDLGDGWSLSGAKAWETSTQYYAGGWHFPSSYSLNNNHGFQPHGNYITGSSIDQATWTIY